MVPGLGSTSTAALGSVGSLTEVLLVNVKDGKTHTNVHTVIVCFILMLSELVSVL